MMSNDKRLPHRFKVELKNEQNPGLEFANYYRLAFTGSDYCIMSITAPINGVWDRGVLKLALIRLAPECPPDWTPLEILLDLFPEDEGVREFVLDQLRAALLLAAGGSEEDFEARILRVVMESKEKVNGR